MIPTSRFILEGDAGKPALNFLAKKTLSPETKGSIETIEPTETENHELY